MTWLRLALLFTSAIANHIIYTPPQQATSADEVHGRAGPTWRLELLRVSPSAYIQKRYIIEVYFFRQSTIWVLTIAETLVTLTAAYDKTIASTVKNTVMHTDNFFADCRLVRILKNG